MQQELVSTAGQLLGPVEQQLLQQVAQIIRRCEDDLLNSFETSAQPVPLLSDRRTSTTSTVSTSSTQPQSHPESTAPPAMEAPQVASPSGPAFTDPSNPTHNGSWYTAPGPRRREPEPAVHFRSVPWDHTSAPTPSSEWIDWDAIFPPGPDTVCIEPVPSLSVPLWTQ